VSSYSGTPVVHAVYNELDRIGLLLGLPRLPEEKNYVYKQRLMDVMVHRADSSYLGLIHGITRELGLSIQDTLKIIPSVDGNGDFLLPNPAVVFLETKAYLYSNYSAGTILSTMDRYEEDGGYWTLGELSDAINATGYFTCSILNSINENIRSMTIYNQRSYHTVTLEHLSGSGIVVKLANENLVSGSVVISSEVLTKRVDTLNDLSGLGDFYVDLSRGILYTLTPPSTADTIRYQYIDSTFIAQSSPVIIHNLQSADFQTKMFEQVEDGDGGTSNGLPTALGADIINELLSVYPVSYGK